MDESRHFYVDMIEGKRVWLIAGPFATHEAALARVNEARERAIAHDPMKHFAAIGTCSQPGPVRKTIFGTLEPTSWVARIDSRHLKQEELSL